MAELARGSYGSWDDECSEVAVLLELIGRPAWHAQAACKTAPAKVSWFPELHDNPLVTDAAKAICAGCSARAECAEWAAGQGPDLAGVWGGMAAGTRNAARRAAQRPTAA